MNDIKKNRYLVKKNGYMVDMVNVDFITWKENENEEDNYWVKLHIGNKEARYVCCLFELQELISCWTNMRGSRLDLAANEISGE
jgi:hypothetical protein|tara:strand:+ start:376 stop:627 length:252 start_codon:yes stop_codon:yes gene_type:complete